MICKKHLSNFNRMRQILKISGFTLIEILVAVMIFLLLTGIAAVNYQSANRRARDGRRQADLEEVRTKLEIYRADNPGTGYPEPDWAAVESALVPTYISALPSDPRSGLYTYYYEGTASVYSLCAYLESGGTSPCALVGTCGLVGGEACNYCVCSP
jgi:prepilin-type N-terminal cleavage/methylation domain-containing protein